MPQDYQSKRNNPYRLPDELYREMARMIRGYDRYKSEYEEILHASPVPGEVFNSGIFNPTERKALRLAAVTQRMEAIEQALVRVPEEYRYGVFRQARYGGGFPIDASRSCYQKWKQRFVYWTAEELHLI